MSTQFEDRLAIRELLEHYADAVTCVDADAWGATWAEDGVWELPEYPQIGTVRGRDNIVAIWKAAMPNYPKLLFLSHPGVIEMHGARAHVRSYTSEAYNPSPEVTQRVHGLYEDVVVKRNGSWLFLSRKFRTVHRY